MLGRLLVVEGADIIERAHTSYDTHRGNGHRLIRFNCLWSALSADVAPSREGDEVAVSR